MTPLIETNIPCKLEISNLLPPNFPGCRIVERPICTYWFSQGYLTIQEIISDNYTLSYHLLSTKESLRYKCKLDPSSETFIFFLNGNSVIPLNEQQISICSNQWLRIRNAKEINLDNEKEDLVEVIFLKYKGRFLCEMKELFPSLFTPTTGIYQNKAQYLPLDSREYIQQILHCNFESDIRRHYIDSKVEDIVFNILVSVTGENPIKDINQEDHEKIKFVELLLSKDLLQQRTLQSLADEIGMGLTKFKQLFKSVYHLTPGEYQRTLRFKQATDYLLKGYSVKESAYKSGMRPSNFILIFKDVYNTTPAKFKKERRNKSN